MTSTTHAVKPIMVDLRKCKEKESRRIENQHNSQHVSSTSTSNITQPKRYQSVFTEGTPLAAFGVKNDDHHSRSRSPPNQIQPQIHQRALKPVKEFLTTHSTIDQQIDDHRHPVSQINGFSRSQTETTIQNVNVALTKTLNKLRPEVFTPTIVSGRQVPINSGSSNARPVTARFATYQNTGTTTAISASAYQHLSANKGSLPTELLTRRSVSSFGAHILPNSTSHNRVSTGTGPLIVPQTIVNKIEGKTNENQTGRLTGQLRTQASSLDVGLHQLDKFNFDNVTLDEQSEKRKADKNGTNQVITKLASRKQTTAPQAPTSDSQHRALPEVSVNPQIQSSVQQGSDQLIYMHEPIPIVDKHVNNHHHIQVEPTNTMKRVLSAAKSQQIFDLQPTVVVQHHRATSSPSTSRPNSAANIIPLAAKESLNQAYVDRDNNRGELFSTENANAHNNNHNDSTSTLKQYENEQQSNTNADGVSTPPPSPMNKETSRLWRKQRSKYSFKTNPTYSSIRKSTKPSRPPARLKNYDSESDSKMTPTENQSKEEVDLGRCHAPVPSDLGSDTWSDLTSEFSDTKLRKHPNVRTSTPNITRYSSSLSSKEVGQIRKQLTDLQIMYNDLLKLLDIDIESVRSSIKSSTSSQTDKNSRKRRFRKVAPLTPIHNSNSDIKEINQRFTRVESSIVTLAESIAKLSAQIQMQRVIKDDVYNLRQEVAELRQQIYNPHARQQCPTSAGGRTSSMSTVSQQQSRFISANVQRVAAANTTNPLNISTSYMPSSSTMIRSNSIIDPRQARKIEQFFGAEAMLRYFLSLLNYEEYVSVLEQDKIGFYELPYISERKLQSLGIPYGACARIIYEAQQYFISLLTLKSNGIDV